MEGYTSDALYRAEKTQFKAKNIKDDKNSPMKYKSSDGHLFNRFYYVEPILDCSDLMDQDLCFYDYIRDDEKMSEIENNENAFYLWGDNFV